MDRNSAIGVSLIIALLVLYFFFLSPTPATGPVTTLPETPALQPQDTSQAVQSNNDPNLVKDYGQFASALTGEEKISVVSNGDLSITFSNNGRIKIVELQQYKTYYKDPLYLVQPENNSFSLRTKINGKDIDLYQLRYSESQQKRGDTTVVIYTATVDGGASISHVYSVPPSGYVLGYKLETSGLRLENNALTFDWRDNIPLQEKSVEDSRAKTTVNFYGVAGGFDGISEGSLDLSSMTLSEPVKWASIRQKFFTSAIIASGSFTSGEISTVVSNDNKHVKDATVRLLIPAADVESGKAKFSYFFGPTRYEILSTVAADDFNRNLYLGWPPVVWVNKFVILPIFNFLEGFVSNYGLLITLLVLIIKLLLTPLSYKSYLGMAKMKLLKPELDLIKEKNGENLTQAQQDQMKLYQQAGVNPFSGCIPLLLQMPIILAMFYFFQVSIEMRQESFLWAEDLSTYDSILNLPFTIPFYGDHVSLFVLLMTVSTLISQWQNNQISTVTGPMKSMSYIMPVIFLFMLNNFSAGLSYYYLVSNLVTFAQQAIIRKFVDEGKIKAVMDDHKKKMTAGGATGKKSGFMARLEDAMKASEESRKKNSRK